MIFLLRENSPKCFFGKRFVEKRFIGINLIADQSAYTWGLIHQGQMLITFINIDRGYKMYQHITYSIEIHKWVDALS